MCMKKKDRQTLVFIYKVNIMRPFDKHCTKKKRIVGYHALPPPFPPYTSICYTYTHCPSSFRFLCLSISSCFCLSPSPSLAFLLSISLSLSVTVAFISSSIFSNENLTASLSRLYHRVTL